MMIMQVQRMNGKIARMYEKSSIFPIVYMMKNMEKAVKCERSSVVLLGRILNILNAKRIIHLVKSYGKLAIVDLDLVSGLSLDECCMDFISKEAGADGIISTHRMAVNQAKKKRLVTCLKVFAYDEFSLDSAVNSIQHCEPDMVELLPGAVLPLVIDDLKKRIRTPINASGLMDTSPQYIRKLLDIGVSAVHTSDIDLWDMEFCKNGKTGTGQI